MRRVEIERGKNRRRGEEEAHVVKCDVERAKCGENPWKLITIRARFTDAASLSASPLTFVERLLARDRYTGIQVIGVIFTETRKCLHPWQATGIEKVFGARLSTLSTLPTDHEEEAKQEEKKIFEEDVGIPGEGRREVGKRLR